MRMALWLLVRNLRGSLRALFIGLVLVVLSVVAIATFTDRMERAVLYSSNVLLAADLVVSSRKEVSAEYSDRAVEQGLRTSLMATFSSVLFGPQEALLASIKAVDAAYPMRGSVLLSDAPFAPGSPVKRAPNQGEIWLESRLAALLNVQPGSDVEFGSITLKFTQVLVREPDPGQGFGYAPRALVNLADIPAAGVLRPGSRVMHRLLIAGERQQVEDYAEGLTLAEGERLWQVGDSQPALARAMANGKMFLLLSTLLIVLTCGASAGMSARRYAATQIRNVGLFKAQGSTPAQVLKLLSWQLAALGLSAWFLGAVLGWGVQMLLGALATEWLEVELPPANMFMLLSGALGLLILYGFALPPLLGLYQLPPMAVLRRGHDLDSGFYGWLLPLSSIAVALAVVLWRIDQWTLVAIVGASVLGVSLLSYTTVRYAAWGLGRVGRLAGGWWRLLGANLRQGQQPIQLTVATLALFTGLVLAAVRIDLLDEWQRAIPDNAPDHFIYNISHDEIDSVRGDLQNRGWEHSDFFPMLNARLLAVDDETLQADSTLQRRARDINLSWAAELPESNQIIEGDWWQQSALPQPRVSLEEEFAARYGASIGSMMTLQLGDQVLKAHVASIRRVDWNTMQPGFWALIEPGLLDQSSSLYIGSFRVGEGGGQELYQFLRTWPALALISTSAIMQQIQSLVAQLSWAVAAIFILVLAAIALVLYVIMVNAHSAQFRQVMVLRALGVTAHRLRQVRRIELACRGLLAGILAAGFTELALAGIQYWVLDVPLRAHLWLWWVGPLAGALLLPVITLLDSRETWTNQPAELLRSAGD